ncbi:MAG: dihydrofolate reductase [Chromatiales bacterium]
MALDENRIVGWDNTLPWHVPSDLKRFKKITMGKPVIMGRKTFQSIGKPLPGRRNVVLTKDRSFEAPGCLVIHDADDALRILSGSREVMVIGGGEVYRRFLPLAERIYMTVIHGGGFFGETSFPKYEESEWREIRRKESSRSPHPYSFIVLERRG